MRKKSRKRSKPQPLATENSLLLNSLQNQWRQLRGRSGERVIKYYGIAGCVGVVIAVAVIVCGAVAADFQGLDDPARLGPRIAFSTSCIFGGITAMFWSLDKLLLATTFMLSHARDEERSVADEIRSMQKP